MKVGLQKIYLKPLFRALNRSGAEEPPMALEPAIQTARYSF
jgi:hypothetical protein